MFRSRTLAQLWILVVVLGLLPAGFFVLRQLREDRFVRTYLQENGLAGLPVTRETAVRVSDHVREVFNTDESTFVAIDMARRPFLRHDVAWLLTHREGLCGQGARAVIGLLQGLGFDATRIHLYDRHFRSSHSLVSVVLDGEEFLVDSIFSAPAFNRLLRTENIGVEVFPLVGYADDLTARREAFRKLESDTAWAPFAERFVAYSYEAVPVTKVLNKVGLDLQVFNFRRPPLWVSSLAEKPNRILAVGLLGVSLVLDLVLFLILRGQGGKPGRLQPREAPAIMAAL